MDEEETQTTESFKNNCEIGGHLIKLFFVFVLNELVNINFIFILDLSCGVNKYCLIS